MQPHRAALYRPLVQVLQGRHLAGELTVQVERALRLSALLDHQVQRALLLHAVVLRIAAVLQLLACEDEALRANGDSSLRAPEPGSARKRQRRSTFCSMMCLTSIMSAYRSSCSVSWGPSTILM